MALPKKYLSAHSAVVPVFLIICIGAIGMRLSGLVRPASSDLNSVMLPASQPAVPVSAGELSPQEVAELSLFGEVNQPRPVPPAAELDNVPKTRLDLTLNAVFADVAEARASAVIAVENNTHKKRYFIGETLPGNVILYAIYADYVILKRDEQLEKLVFPRDRPE